MQPPPGIGGAVAGAGRSPLMLLRYLSPQRGALDADKPRTRGCAPGGPLWRGTAVFGPHEVRIT